MAILEVGLGGRLDATNIIARPVQKPLPCSFANCASVHSIDTGTETKQGTAIAAHRRIRLWSLFSKPHRWRPAPAGQSCAESPVSTTTTSRRAARQLARPRHMHAAALCLRQRCAISAATLRTATRGLSFLAVDSSPLKKTRFTRVPSFRALASTRVVSAHAIRMLFCWAFVVASPFTIDRVATNHPPKVKPSSSSRPRGRSWATRWPRSRARRAASSSAACPASRTLPPRPPLPPLAQSTDFNPSRTAWMFLNSILFSFEGTTRVVGGTGTVPFFDWPG